MVHWNCFLSWQIRRWLNIKNGFCSWKKTGYEDWWRFLFAYLLVWRNWLFFLHLWRAAFRKRNNSTTKFNRKKKGISLRIIVHFCICYVHRSDGIEKNLGTTKMDMYCFSAMKAKIANFCLKKKIAKKSDYPVQTKFSVIIL